MYVKKVSALAAVAAVGVSLAATGAVAQADVKPNGKQSVAVSEVARQETVKGVKYTAKVKQSFDVKFKKGDVKFAGGYKASLNAIASPAAASELTLISTKAGKPSISDTSKRVVVKGKGKVKKARVDAVVVTGTFTGVVKTKFGTLYKQSGTLTTTVLDNGDVSSKVKLGPEIKVG